MGKKVKRTRKFWQKPEWLIPIIIGLLFGSGLIIKIINQSNNVVGNNNTNFQIEGNNNKIINGDNTIIINPLANQSGITISPKEISYFCGGERIIRDINLRNVGSELEENIYLELFWPKNVSLTEFSLNDASRTSIHEEPYIALKGSDNLSNVLSIINIPSISPGENLKFELKLKFTNCSGFKIYLNVRTAKQSGYPDLSRIEVEYDPDKGFPETFPLQN